MANTNIFMLMPLSSTATTSQKAFEYLQHVYNAMQE